MNGMNVDLNTILSDSGSSLSRHIVERSVMTGHSQTTGHCGVSGMLRSYAQWPGQISTGEVTA